MQSWFNVVSEDVARNPIARAVQRKRLHDAMRDFQIRLHMLSPGDDAESDIEAAATAIATAIAVLEQRGRLDTPPAKVLRGGISALVAMGGKWDPRQAIAVDVALNWVRVLMHEASPEEARAAWLRVQALEGRA